MARFTSSLIATALLAASAIASTDASSLRSAQVADAVHRDLAEAATTTTTWQAAMLAAVNAERNKTGAPALCLNT